MLKVPETRADITLEWLNEAFKKYDFEILKFSWNGQIGAGLGALSSLERLTLDILHLEDENNNQEIQQLNIIVKTLPIGSPELRHFVVNEGFCQREFKMYTKVFPAWAKFQESRRTPSKYRFRYPACYYGGEIGEGEDYRMILLLEDMISSNFHVWTEGYRQGLKWKEAKPVVKQIALFHAVGMAFKEYQGIKNYSEEYPFLYTKSKDQDLLKYFLKSGVNSTVQMLKDNTLTDSRLEIPQGLIDDLKAFGDETIDTIQELKFPREGRAGTICHHDLHANNIMLSQPQNINNKMDGDAALLDFQGCCYSSPMNDLTFFLLLSCDPSLFTTELPKVLEYYYEVFREAMYVMDMDVEYTLDQITEDYDSCLVISIIHIVMGAQAWIFGPSTSEDTLRRFKLALVSSYNRAGFQLSFD